MRTSSTIPFVKMHSLGNDFMIVDAIAHPNLSALFHDDCRGFVMCLSDRHCGIGFDQLLLLIQDERGFVYRIFNADGSEAKQCGNGARCLRAYISAQGYVLSDELITLHCIGGDVRACCLANQLVETYWPLAASWSLAPAQQAIAINADDYTHEQTQVSVGNTHLLIPLVSQAFSVLDLPAITQDFRERSPDCAFINMEYLTIDSERGSVQCRVFEAGVGETSACGSGACAIAYACWKRGWISADKTIEVVMSGGVTNSRKVDDVIVQQAAVCHVFYGYFSGES